MRHLVRCLYAPLFFFGFIGMAIFLVHLRQLTPLCLVPLLLLALLVNFAAEAWLPFDPHWNRAQDDAGSDVAHVVVNEMLNVAALGVVPLLAALSPWAGVWPQHWPWLVQLLVAIVVADAGITLMHYFSHRSALLWRLHAVHHSALRLYGLNGWMKHPLHQLIEAGAGTLPLIALGMPVPIAAMLAFAISIQLLLQHANVAMRCGPLRHMFAWAPVHRLHHIRYGVAGNVNFGLFLTVWDRLLGTRFDAPDVILTSADLGIGGRLDYPRGYLAQLCAPFGSQHDTSAAPSLPAELRRR